MQRQAGKYRAGNKIGDKEGNRKSIEREIGNTEQKMCEQPPNMNVYFE